MEFVFLGGMLLDNPFFVVAFLWMLKIERDIENMGKNDCYLKDILKK